MNIAERKAVKKRKVSEAQGGKKRKVTEDAKGNTENNMDTTKGKVEEKLAENAVTSTESSAKTQKKKVSKESKPKKEKAAKVIIKNNDNSVVEHEENICEISTSSKSKLSVPKGKQQGKKRSKGEAVSVSQDSPVEKEAKVKLSLMKDNKRSSSQSCDSEVKKVSKELDSQKNGARNVVKKKTTSLEQEREIKESRNSNEEGASSSEVSDQKEAFKEAAHSEQHPPKPHKPSFALKRSTASTDVRVPLDEGTARKKSLPKLVKAFKPPMAKEGKTGKGSKMPNLLKPSFVSPALAKPESKPDDRKDGGREVAQSNAVKKNTAPRKESTLKRKTSKKDQCLSETPKKSKKDKEHDDILSGKFTLT